MLNGSRLRIEVDGVRVWGGFGSGFGSGHLRVISRDNTSNLNP